MPYDVFADLRARLDCRDIAKDGGLKVGTRGYFECPSQSCPQVKSPHDLKVKCTDGETFHCMACGAGRDVVDLIGLIWGLSPADALQEAKRRAGLDSDFPPPPPPKRPPPEKLVIGQADLAQRLQALTIAEDHYDRLRREGDAYLSGFSAMLPPRDQAEILKWLPVARDYLECRGIPPLAQLPLKLGLAPVWRNGLRERLVYEGGDELVQAALRCGLLIHTKNGLFERFKGRVFMAWHGPDGKVWNAKGRAIPDLTKPAGLRVAEDTGKLRLPMDFLRTNDTDPKRPPHMPPPPLPYGWRAASDLASVRSGSTAQPLPFVAQEGEIDALSALMAGVPSIATGGTTGVGIKATKGLVKERGRDNFVVVFDGDASGVRGGKKLSIAFRCPWTTLAEGQDTNDILKTGGTGAVRLALAEAVRHARHEAPETRSKPKQEPGKRKKTEPVEDDLGMPPGWTMEKGRLCRLVPVASEDGGKPEFVPQPTRIRSPAKIVWTGRDIADGTITLGIAGAVIHSGNVAEVAVQRDKVKQTREIVKALAPHGLDVDSRTAGTLVDFLTDYEHAFGERLPFRRGAKQFGWHGKSFLYGNDCYGPEKISYIGSEVGVLQALGSKGEHAEWVKGVLEPLQRYQRAMVAFYASLCAPIVKFVPGLSGFCLELAGDSSGGKSTVSAATVSAWGDSSENSGYLRPPNDTINAQEVGAALFNNLPIVIEDAHQLRNARETVMALANGMGKGRSQPTGDARQESRQWATVALLTGEHSVGSTTSFAGVIARILSLPPPLPRPTSGPEDEAVVADIDSINETRVEHYGHAGRLWIKWLVDGHLREVLDAYNVWLPTIRRHASHDGPQQRWARYFSLILAVADKAHPIIGGRDVTSDILEVAVNYFRDTPSPDQAEDVLDMCLAWVAMSGGEGVTGSGEVAKASQRITWWRVEDDFTVCMSYAYLKKRLADEGVSVDQMRKAWMERGYLAYKGKPMKGKVIRLGGGPATCIPVRPERAGFGVIDEDRVTDDAPAEGAGLVH